MDLNVKYGGDFRARSRSTLGFECKTFRFGPQPPYEINTHTVDLDSRSDHSGVPIQDSVMQAHGFPSIFQGFPPIYHFVFLCCYFVFKISYLTDECVVPCMLFSIHIKNIFKYEPIKPKDK